LGFQVKKTYFQGKIPKRHIFRLKSKKDIFLSKIPKRHLFRVKSQNVTTYIFPVVTGDKHNFVRPKKLLVPRT